MNIAKDITRAVAMKIDYLVKVFPYFVTPSALLLLLYLGVMRLTTGSMEIALGQFKYYLPWILTLSGGFGVQVAIYKLMNIMSQSTGKAAGVAKATGVTSTATMLACCAHHAVDVLPILGLSAIASFLDLYTKQLFFIGIVFNVFGIVYMLKHMRGIYYEKN